MRIKRPKFSIRLLMLTVGFCCVFLALDNAVQRQGSKFKNLAKTEPEKLGLKPFEMDGTPTLEIGVANTSSFFDQILFRRHFQVHYSGYVQNGNTFTNVDDEHTYRTTFGGFRRLSQ